MVSLDLTLGVTPKDSLGSTAHGNLPPFEHELISGYVLRR